MYLEFCLLFPNVDDKHDFEGSYEYGKNLVSFMNGEIIFDLFLLKVEYQSLLAVGVVDMAPWSTICAPAPTFQLTPVTASTPTFEHVSSKSRHPDHHGIGMAEHKPPSPLHA